MGYRQLIGTWHTKAATEEDYFSKFVFEYLAFIAYLKTQLYPGDRKDRQAIQKLKQNKDIKQKYLQKVNYNDNLKEAWEKIRRELDRFRLGNTSGDLNNPEEIDWWNCSRNELNQRCPEEREKLKGVIHSLEDWENMVEFWYSIRNNLFHGTKNPEDPRDILFVKYGYRTLKELMEIMLDGSH